MTEDETVLLTRYVRAMCPQQKVDEYTADAWFDVLAPYSLAEARAAVGRHVAAGNAFIAVGEILTMIRLLRSERLEDFQYEPQPGDDNPRQYLANLRAQRAAVAAGRRPPVVEHPALPAAPDRDLQKAIESSFTREMPKQDEPEPSKPGSPLSVPCPTCAARIGHHCRMRVGIRRTTVHSTRQRVALGLPSYNPADQVEAERRRQASAAALATLTDAERAQLAAHIREQQETR